MKILEKDLTLGTFAEALLTEVIDVEGGRTQVI